MEDKPGSGKTVLVTGAAGYVGTHCIVEYIEKGFDVVGFDNFSNATRDQSSICKTHKPESLLRIERMTGKTIEFEEVDMRDLKSLKKAISKYSLDCVLHAAAHKAVAESRARPLDYYDNNVVGSLNLVRAMDETGVTRLVFSSSSTVYGTPKYLPMDEGHPAGGECTNPYGKTKFMVEEIVKDVCETNKDWGAMLLRYFNPVGAHPSGEIGEDPLGVPYNLMPFIAQVAVGRRPVLQIFGTDYEDTADGTAVRDYVHVMDVASGHVAATVRLLEPDFSGHRTYNLGIGRGTSVLELVRAFEEASGVRVNTAVAGRREGDVSASFAACEKIERELGWKAKLTLHDMCKDMWTWQTKNPSGYRPKEALNGDA